MADEEKREEQPKIEVCQLFDLYHQIVAERRRVLISSRQGDFNYGQLLIMIHDIYETLENCHETVPISPELALLLTRWIVTHQLLAHPPIATNPIEAIAETIG